MNIHVKSVFSTRRALLGHQFRELNALLSHTSKHNAFYRQFYARHGMKVPAKLKSWDDFRRLPLLTKADLQKDQEQHPPFGHNVASHGTSALKIRFTSGTTGKPLYVPESVRDMLTKSKMLQKKYYRFGIRPGDRVLMIWSTDMYEIHAGVFLALGATVLVSEIRSNKSALEMILHNRITAICTIPSIAIHLIAVAKQNKLNIKNSSVQKIYLTGEPGGEDEEFKRKIGEAFGAKCYNMGGSTETDQIQSECIHNPGNCHLAEEFSVMEVIDPVSLKPADKGELIITTIWKKDSPLIRYRTGDIVDLNRTPCPCGDKTLLIRRGILGRIGRSFKYNGIIIYVSGIESIIRRQLSITDYKIKIFRGFTGDYVSILIHKDNKKSVNLRQLKEDLKGYLGNTPGIKFTPMNVQVNPMWKSDKIIDYRNTYMNFIVGKFPFLDRLL